MKNFETRVLQDKTNFDIFDKLLPSEVFEYLSEHGLNKPIICVGADIIKCDCGKNKLDMRVQTYNKRDLLDVFGDVKGRELYDEVKQEGLIRSDVGITGHIFFFTHKTFFNNVLKTYDNSVDPTNHLIE